MAILKTNILNKLTLIFCMYFAVNAVAFAQSSINRMWQEEYWFGAFFTHKLHKNVSLWHDYHFATRAFYVFRPGLMYHFPYNITGVAGYAYVATNTPFTQEIIRNEHRLWWQLEQRINIQSNITFRNRLRYEGRWRRTLVGKELADDFVFNHRLRWMSSLRIILHATESSWKWHFNPMAEWLWFVPADFSAFKTDQARVYLLPGATHRNITAMAGYYMRIFPPASQRRVIRHGVCCWLSFSF